MQSVPITTKLVS